MPTSIRWACRTELTAEEARVAQALHRIGKFYVFLRDVRAELFDDAFQAELAAVYQPRGTAPVPPALLAMVLLLQAYDQVADAEAVVSAQLDQRWQLVLGCLGATKAPFSQGVLVKFRERMIAHDLDRKLLTRTIELAKRTGKFGWQHLQAALDSAPLLGAGRIEDTWNLIGRALSAVVTCAAKAVDRPRAQVIAAADLTLVDRSSLKAALDIDWDDAEAQAAALERLLGEVDRMEQWVAGQPPTVQAAPALQEALTALRAVLTQDLEPDPTTGRRRILRGVAKGRQPSLGDPEMRHGRKSRSRPFTGYKRHVVKLLEPDLIVEAVARPANEPEHTVLATLTTAVAHHGPMTDLWMDRGYLASPAIPALTRGASRSTPSPGPPAMVSASPSRRSRFAWPSAWWSARLSRSRRCCPVDSPCSLPPIHAEPARCVTPAPRPPRVARSRCTRRKRCSSSCVRRRGRRKAERRFVAVRRWNTR
jgi:Transposase domain (DUF772)